MNKYLVEKPITQKSSIYRIAEIKINLKCLKVWDKRLNKAFHQILAAIKLEYKKDKKIIRKTNH